MTDEATPPASKDAALAAPEAPAPAPAPANEGGAEGPYRSAPAAPEAKPWRPNYVFLLVVSIVTLAADLGSKGWAKARLEDARFSDRRIEVVHDLVGFIFARNRGGAWGLLQDQPESIRRPFFLTISVVAVVFIVSLYRKLTPQQLALKWGLPLVLGGALGNLVNRIQLNYVVDFIDFQARWGGREHHWPTFNIADVAIVAGVGLMAVDMFTSRRSAAPASTLAATSTSVTSVASPAPSDAGVAPPFPPDAPVAPPADAAPRET